MKRILIFILILNLSNCSKKEEIEKVLPQNNFVKLTEVEIRNGTLFLKWDSLDFENVEYGKLVIIGGGDSRELILYKDDLELKEFNDKLSVANKIIYKLKIHYLDGSVSYESNIQFTYPEIKYKQILIDYNLYKFTSEKHPLFNNFTSYEYSANLGGYEENIINNLGEDVFFKYSLVFGDYPNNVIIKYMRGNEYVNYVDLRDFHLGNNFSNTHCEDFLYRKSDDFIYTVKIESDNKLYILKLNSNNLEEVEREYILEIDNSAAIDMTIDENNNQIVLDVSKEKSFLIDLSNLNLLKTYNFKDFNSNIYNAQTFYRNGIFVVRSLYQYDDEVNFYDADSKIFLFKVKHKNDFSISDSGKYFFSNDKVYKIENKALIEISSISSINFFPSVLFINDEKMICSEKAQKPIILDLKTLSKTKIEDIDNSIVIQFDETTNNMLFLEKYFDKNLLKARVHVYNFNKNESKKLEVVSTNYPEYYRLVNGILIFTRGKYLSNYFKN